MTYLGSSTCKNSSGPRGPGTLRQSMLCTNEEDNTDVIYFESPLCQRSGNGVWRYEEPVETSCSHPSHVVRLVMEICEELAGRLKTPLLCPGSMTGMVAGTHERQAKSNGLLGSIVRLTACFTSAIVQQWTPKGPTAADKCTQ